MAKNKGGRPKKPIDQKQFEALCKIQCTEEEICAVLDVDEKTLIAWCKETYGESFSKVFRDKKQGGRASLRRNQWKLSETNATMAIWLGKQFLGQKDNIDIKSENTQKVYIVDEIPEDGGEEYEADEETSTCED